MTIACCEALFCSGYKLLAPQYISPPKTLIKISKPWAFKRQFRVFKLILTKVCILFYFYYTFDDCQNSDLLWLVKKTWQLTENVYSPSGPFPSQTYNQMLSYKAPRGGVMR